jgi:hypothetical protein
MDIFSNIDPNTGFNYMSALALGAGIFTLIALGGSWYFGNEKDNQTAIAIAKSQTEAAIANVGAANANAEAAKANKIAKSIELDLEKAKKEAKSQEEKVENLKLKVEQEAIQRAKAEAELLKLQQKVGWRNLNEHLFIAIFKQYSYNSEKIEIIYNADDLENQFFAQSIARTLHKAGCTVGIAEGIKSTVARPFAIEYGGGATSDPEYRGLNILIPDTEENPYKDEKSSLFALNKAFKKCGFSPLFFGGYPEIRPPRGTIKIVVDSRL